MTYVSFVILSFPFHCYILKDAQLHFVDNLFPFIHQQGGSYIHARGFSVHHVFKKISVTALVSISLLDGAFSITN
jgi:hypothetical protein